MVDERRVNLPERGQAIGGELMFMSILVSARGELRLYRVHASEGRSVIPPV